MVGTSPTYPSFPTNLQQQHCKDALVTQGQILWVLRVPVCRKLLGFAVPCRGDVLWMMGDWPSSDDFPFH